MMTVTHGLLSSGTAPPVTDTFSAAVTSINVGDSLGFTIYGNAGPCP